MVKVDPPDTAAQEARARAPFTPGFRALVGMRPGRYRPRKPVLTREQEAELSALLDWKQ